MIWGVLSLSESRHERLNSAKALTRNEEHQGNKAIPDIIPDRVNTKITSAEGQQKHLADGNIENRGKTLASRKCEKTFKEKLPD